ncbi:MAG: hypothetical protein M5R36_28475 [Deltaproteobacteria bacterium]|nr:hypothetical protein [Deltaproteobacteria bacterium]
MPADLARVLEPFTAGKRLVVLASTHEGEERSLLERLPALLGRYGDAVVLLAPRHRERFDDVWALLEKTGVPAARRSAGPPPSATRLLLLDTHGELGGAFRFATAAFMGGTLVPVGGHNVVEPAAAGVPVVFGPHMENFRAEEALLREAGAAARVENADAAVDALRAWLADPDEAKRCGQAGADAVAGARGALEATLALLADTHFLE